MKYCRRKDPNKLAAYICILSHINYGDHAVVMHWTSSLHWFQVSIHFERHELLHQSNFAADSLS